MLEPSAVTPSTRPPLVTTWPSLQRGAGVEYLYIGHFCGFVETADRLATLVIARVTFAGHHDADGRPRVPLGRCDFVETAIDGRFQ